MCGRSARLRRARAIALAAAAGLSLVLAGTAAARLLLPSGTSSGPSLLVYEVTLCLLAGGLLAGLLAAPGSGTPSPTWLSSSARPAPARSEENCPGRSATLPRDRLLAARPGRLRRRRGPGAALPGPVRSRSMTVVERQGQPVAALVHDPAVLDDPRLVEAVSLRGPARGLERQAPGRSAGPGRGVRGVAPTDLSEARDEQRRRLEHRLHEGAAARLRAAGGTCCAVAERSATGQRTRDQIARAEDQLQHTLEELRRLATRAASARAVRAGAGGRAGRHWPRTSRSRSVSRSQMHQLPSRVAAAAYFVCAEALTNAAKHAAASRVTVAVTAGDGQLRVEIEDDGVGGADPGRGSGLRGLADRVETLGGTLQVESVPGHGTRLAAEIPLGGEAR